MEKNQKDKIRKRKNNKGYQSNTEHVATRGRTDSAITLIALVITIVLNCLYLAMERMLKKVKILKKEKTSCII